VDEIKPFECPNGLKTEWFLSPGSKAVDAMGKPIAHSKAPKGVFGTYYGDTCFCQALRRFISAKGYACRSCTAKPGEDRKKDYRGCAPCRKKMLEQMKKEQTHG